MHQVSRKSTIYDVHHVVYEDDGISRIKLTFFYIFLFVLVSNESSEETKTNNVLCLFSERSHKCKRCAQLMGKKRRST